MSYPDNDTPMFARSPFGKCDDEIKFRCPAELKFKTQALAYSYGMDMSDFVREVVSARVLGVEHVESLALARIRAVAGGLGQTGNERGTDGGQQP